jgi:hypothetical protein
MLRRVALVRAIRRNIAEDAILHSHRRENVKSYRENSTLQKVDLGPVADVSSKGHNREGVSLPPSEG